MQSLANSGKVLSPLGDAAEASLSIMREMSLLASPPSLTSEFSYVKEPHSDNGNWK